MPCLKYSFSCILNWLVTKTQWGVELQLRISDKNVVRKTVGKPQPGLRGTLTSKNSTLTHSKYAHIEKLVKFLMICWFVLYFLFLGEVSGCLIW